MISMVHQHKNKTKIVYTAYIKGRFVVQIIIKNKLQPIRMQKLFALNEKTFILIVKYILKRDLSMQYNYRTIPK